MDILDDVGHRLNIELPDRMTRGTLQRKFMDEVKEKFGVTDEHTTNRVRFLTEGEAIAMAACFINVESFPHLATEKIP